MHQVYVQADDSGRIVAVSSDAFLPHDMPGWRQIDQGEGDRYMHAQGHYLPGLLRDEQGRYLYKIVDGAVVPRTEEELVQDVAQASGPTLPTDAERLAALEAAMLEMILGGGIGG